MIGKTPPFIRTFLWLTRDNDNNQQIGIYHGQTIIKAIMLSFQHDNKFIYWDDGDFDNNASLSEKVETTLSRLENGDHEINITIMDITEPASPVIIFPRENRIAGFDDSIVGYQYTIESFIKAVDDEDQTKFDSYIEAKKELENLQSMQPENMYRLKNVTLDIVTS